MNDPASQAVATGSAGATIAAPDSIGSPASKIPVELSTRFLHHFSEQLYSSPQKAFEELISNGWDAGANYVDVRISSDLADPNATLCVLDNGVSMDAEGLRQLWHIAFSPKAGVSELHGRKVIGKFGIGKLATYVLANKLTYLCKAADGKIRRVTMDYGDIDPSDKLVRELELDLYEVTDTDFRAAVGALDAGPTILSIIDGGLAPPPKTAIDDTNDQFGDAEAPPALVTSATWTLAVLSSLKPTGRELRVNVLKRMLEAALPFGSVMAISINGERLSSSKIDSQVMKTWVIGPELKISELELGEGADDVDDSPSPTPAPSGRTKKANRKAVTAQSPAPTTKITITTNASPASIDIPGVGRVTGRVSLFVDRISGGKSEERGASNGFHVNVLGRVVNQADPSFGEKNLSHAAWARFRMTVRADGLNEFLTTDREKFMEKRELKIFRAFLRQMFNVARQHYDSDPNAELPKGGDVLVNSLGVLSLSPLRNVVSETLRTQAPLPGLFDENGVTDRKEKRRSWREETADNIRNALGQVKYEKLDDDTFVKFRISDNTIVINKNHPFTAEHSRTRAEKELLRTVAMVTLLTDVYALDLGIEPPALSMIREYRDRLMRYRAMQRRQSGLHIARLLLSTQHDSGNSKLLETAVSDALRYLGFQVLDLAKPGEPEGIASAYPTPTQKAPTDEDPHPPLYSFSFDAKSSKHDAASTGNIKLDGIAEHRDRYGADHALVIAPGFNEGALATRCEQQRVTPIMAKDLGRLLEYTVEYGAVPLTKLREMFSIFDPSKVTEWVDGLESWIQKKRPLTIDVFLKALEKLKGKVPDVLSASTIALACREFLKARSVQQEDVVAVAKGLSILIPDLVGIEGDRIIVNASSARVAAAVESQLEKLHEESTDAPEGGIEDLEDDS